LFHGSKDFLAGPVDVNNLIEVLRIKNNVTSKFY